MQPQKNNRTSGTLISTSEGCSEKYTRASSSIYTSHNQQQGFITNSLTSKNIPK